MSVYLSACLCVYIYIYLCLSDRVPACLSACYFDGQVCVWVGGCVTGTKVIVKACYPKALPTCLDSCRQCNIDLLLSISLSLSLSLYIYIYIYIYICLCVRVCVRACNSEWMVLRMVVGVNHTHTLLRTRVRRGTRAGTYTHTHTHRPASDVHTRMTPNYVNEASIISWPCPVAGREFFSLSPANKSPEEEHG